MNRFSYLYKITTNTGAVIMLDTPDHPGKMAARLRTPDAYMVPRTNAPRLLIQFKTVFSIEEVLPESNQKGETKDANTHRE